MRPYPLIASPSITTSTGHPKDRDCPEAIAHRTSLPFADTTMDQDSEKGGVVHKPVSPRGSDDAFPLDSVSDAEKRRIIRRIDLRLVTTVGALYCVSLMDRTNLSAAAIAGMLEDLMMIGNRYVCRPSNKPQLFYSLTQTWRRATD